MGRPFSVESPGVAATFQAVTPGDAYTVNADGARGLYIGVSGDVVLTPLGGGTNVTFKSVPVGILPVAHSLVVASGTTATDMVALF